MDELIRTEKIIDCEKQEIIHSQQITRCERRIWVGVVVGGVVFQCVVFGRLFANILALFECGMHSSVAYLQCQYAVNDRAQLHFCVLYDEFLRVMRSATVHKRPCCNDVCVAVIDFTTYQCVTCVISSMMLL